MDKVGQRINRLMESCQKGEKVLLLFSVNAQKSYCGLGYLTGPWVEKSSAQLEGWMEREDGTKTMGYVCSQPLLLINTKRLSVCSQ